MARRPTISLCVVLLIVASAIVLGLSAVPARATVYPSPSYHFDGTVAGEFSASSMVLMDLNRDGIADLAVGSQYNGTAEQGSVTFYLSSGGLPFKTVITTFGWPGSHFGFSMANVGDVAGAGTGPVLAVGAPTASPRGHVGAGNITFFYPRTTFSGAPSAWINGTHAGDELGFSLSGAGDVNNDNTDDIVAGAPYCNVGATGGGCAYVFYGASPHPHLVPDLVFDSAQAGANLGFSVAGNGSVDGSTAPSFAFGAPNYPPLDSNNRGAGAVYVFRNPLATNRSSLILGANAGDQFGSSVAMGDFNGDTIDDVAMGAPYHDTSSLTQAGEVSVVYGGSPFKTTNGDVLDGQAAGEWFGSSLAAGDFHRDNVTDLLVGAPGSTVNATGIGRAYGFYGNPVPWTTANLTMVPGDSGANAYGNSLAVGANITRNGPPTFAVGDPQFQVGGKAAAGRAYVFSGDIVPTQNRPRVLGWVCVPFTFTGGPNPCRGLSGFAVSLQSSTLTRTSVTPANGSFAFTVVPGTYWLNTTKYPYIDNSSRFTLSYNQVKTVVIYAMTIPMVNGTATDAVNRTRYPGVTVALYNATGVFVNSTVTNASGRFSMFVPDGFLPPATGPVLMKVSMWDGIHYTNTTSPAFSVRRNQTSIVNMFLNRFPVLNGTVYDKRTGARIGGATVQATQGARVLATVTTNSQGTFGILAVNASQTAPMFLNTTCGGTCGQYGRNQTSLVVKQNLTYTPNIGLLIDRQAPSSNVWPLLPLYTKNAVFSISTNATDNNGIEQVQLWYQYNNNGAYARYAVDTAAPYTFSFNSTSARGDGRYGFYTIAVDYAGNVQAVPSGNNSWTRVDTVNPTLAITKPTAGQTILHSWVNVTWTAADAGSGLLKVDVRLDADAWAHAGLAAYLNLTSVPDGSHTVTVNATDRAGNSRSASVSFSVNTVAPVVTFSAPANNSFSKSATVILTWSITLATGSVTLLQVAVDTGSWQTIANTSTSYTFTGLADGSHQLWVHAAAAGGSTTVYLGVTVDTTAPTVAISSPAGNPWINRSSLTVAFSAADSTSGLASLTLGLDNGAPANVLGQTSYALTLIADGVHQLTLTATDAAGNSATATAGVRVDTAPPSVTLTAPAAGASLSSSTVQVEWSVTDSGSGVGTVQMALDNGSYQTLSPGGSLSYSGVSDGQHTIRIRATDVAGNAVTKSVSFSVTAAAPADNTLLYAGLAAAVIIIVVIVALVVWRMRKPKTPEPPQEQPPKPEEGGKTP